MGRIASLVVLLGAGLYFTGWIYRWAYFSFFQLDIATLPLPAESFYIAAFQALFGSIHAIGKTVLATIGVAIAVYFSLWLFEDLLIGKTQRYLKRYQRQITQSKKPRSSQRRWLKPFRILYHTLLRQLLKLQEYESLRFLRSLVDETIIVIWVLVALFWLARWQANIDAWTDAVHDTTSLPAITIVVQEGTFPFGQGDGATPNNPSGIRTIGSRTLYRNLLVRNDLEDLNWHLLIDLEGDYYLFPALSEDIEPNRRPPVLIVPRSQNGDQLILLSPSL